MTQPKLYAMTLHRPWTTLIARGVKKIENRSWAPLPSMLKPGDWFAIHAGKTYDDTVIAFARTRGVPIEFFDRPGPVSAIECLVRFGGAVTHSEDKWFFGPYGWVLTEAVMIEPVPCRGFQKLWGVPDELLETVRVRFAAARAAVQANHKETVP